VQQLVPGFRERFGQLAWILVEAFRDRAVDRIQPQREVRRQHCGCVPLRRIVRIRHRALGLGILRRPLEGTGGALGQLPVVLVQVVQESVTPLRRRFRPRAFEAAADGVAPLAGAEAVLPAETLQFEWSGLRLGANMVGRRGRTMGLAERVAADDQRRRLLVVHRHACEGLADVPSGREGIRLAIGALGVHVDQAHLHGAEWLAEFPVPAVALVSEPGVLSAPEDLLGLPDVGPPEAEAEGLEAH
jgi:hypothetical protein